MASGSDTRPGARESHAARRLSAVPPLADADADLVRRARLLEADILIGIGELGLILPVRAGRTGAVEPATRLMRSWTFALRAAEADWLRHWEALPDPGWHDILAMSKRGLLTVEGNLVPFMQHLQVVKDLLALPRTIR